MKQFAISISLFLILLILFGITPSFSQQFKWVKGGGTGQDFSSAPGHEWEQTKYICTDPNGNIYALSIVGNFPIHADTFYKSSAYGTYPNTLITSYTCNGVMRWAKLIAADAGDCRPTGIVADSLGHIYVSGFFENLGTHLHIGYDTTTPTPNYQSASIIQFDTSGHFNWLRYVGDNTPGTEEGEGYIGDVLALDAANNAHYFNYVRSGVHITPTVTSIGGTYDLVYNTTGTLISQVRLDLDSEWEINSAVIDPVTNKLYVSGEINQFIYGGFLTDTFYAAAFDASRNLLWKYNTGNDTQASAISGIAIDQNKNLFFSGSSASIFVTIPTEFSFNGMSVTNTIYPIYNMAVVMKTDTNGTPIWIKHIEGNSSIPFFAAITKLPNGKVAVTGTGGDIMTDGSYSIVSPVSEAQNPFMAIYDSMGDLQTIQIIHGNGFYDGCQGPVAITSDRTGNLYIGGYVEDSIWAGSPAIPAYHTVGGNTDFFVLKYGVDCSCTAMPVASFTDTGTHTVGATYTGTMAGVDSIVWNFGDGHTGLGLTVLHTYTVAGTFQLCVTVYTNCGHDSDCTTIVLPCVAPPVAAFTDTGMHTLGLFYTGTTTALDSVLWIYGDGFTDTGLTAHHTYSATGTYHVCAVAYNPCGTDTVCRYDTVRCIAAPVASFTDTGRHTIGCSYMGTTAGTDSIVWKFGDGASATGTTALHTYAAAGIFHVCVIAYSHCGNDTACRYDTVLCVSPPVAAFTDTGHITIGSSYTGTLTAVDSIVWNFGDGATATGTTALHTYTTTGIYHICVTAYSPCGSSTACHYDTLLCIAAPVASFTDTGSHHIKGFTYTGSTAGIDSIVWSFGDGHTATGTAPLHTYTANGTYYVCATVYTPCGIDSACDSVTVSVPASVAVVHAAGNIKAYPNPVSDELNITGITETTQYRLLNVTGECLLYSQLEQGNNIIKMQHIAPGVYILELKNDLGERYIVKVVRD